MSIVASANVTNPTPLTNSHPLATAAGIGAGIGAGVGLVVPFLTPVIGGAVGAVIGIGLEDARLHAEGYSKTQSGWVYGAPDQQSFWSRLVGAVDPNYSYGLQSPWYPANVSPYAPAMGGLGSGMAMDVGAQGTYPDSFVFNPYTPVYPESPLTPYVGGGASK